MDDELRVVEMGAYNLTFENDGDVGEWYEEKARSELRETPELREEAFAKLLEVIDSKWTFEIYLKKREIRQHHRVPISTQMFVYF